MSFYSNGVSGNYLSRADLTDARFSRAAAWSYLIFFKISNTATDDSVLTAKGSNLFYLRTDMSASPTRLELKIHNAWMPSTSNSIAQGEWYLAVVRCNGSGTITLSLYDLDTSLINEVTEARATDHTTENGNEITISRAGTTDPLRGYVAYSCYVKRNISAGDIGSYISDPDDKVASWGTDVVWCLPMTAALAANLGADSSGKGNHFTVNGAPTASADNPPIVPTGTAVEALAPGGSTTAAVLKNQPGLSVTAGGEGASAAASRYVAGVIAVAVGGSESAAQQRKEQGWTVSAPTEGVTTGRIRVKRSLDAQLDGGAPASAWQHLDKGIDIHGRGGVTISAQIKADLALQSPTVSQAINWAEILVERGLAGRGAGAGAMSADPRLTHGLVGSTVGPASVQVPLRLLLQLAAFSDGRTTAGARIVVGELASRVVGNTFTSAYLNTVYAMAVRAAGTNALFAVPRINAGLAADNDNVTQTLLHLLLQKPVLARADGIGARQVQAAVEYTLAGLLQGGGVAKSRTYALRQLLGDPRSEGAASALALALRGHTVRGPSRGTVEVRAVALRRLLVSVTGTGVSRARAWRLLAVAASAAASAQARTHLRLITFLSGRAVGVANSDQALSALRPFIGAGGGYGQTAADLAELIRLIARGNGRSDHAATLEADRALTVYVMGMGAGMVGGTVLNPLVAAADGNLQMAIAVRALRDVVGGGVGLGDVGGRLYTDRKLVAANAGAGLAELILLAERGWSTAISALTQSAARISLDLSLASVVRGEDRATLHLVASRMLAASGVGLGERLSPLRLQLNLDGDGAGYGLVTAEANALRKLQSAITGPGTAEARVYELVRLIGQPESQGNVDVLLNLIMAMALLSSGRARIDSAVAEIEDANYYTQGQIYG